jgi:hypothetical protein
VYSTTARTSVAYRVIGYIESTQATAGTWATAPSTIQGYGGQALAAMSSLGYSQKWTDVKTSPGRAAATTYYNTTGRPILVAASAVGNGGLIQCYSYLTVNGIILGVNGSNSGTAGGASYTAVTGIVPPGASYSYNPSNGAVDYWAELR